MDRSERMRDAIGNAAKERPELVDPKTHHEFSDEYQSRKKALIEEVARTVSGKPAKHRRFGAIGTATRFTWRIAAAVAAICIVAPVAAWAVTSHADFFDSAFGAAWRESKPAEQSFQEHDGLKPPTPIVYPASEVVQLDPEKAEALIGDAVCEEPVSVTSPDGHELTITSSVRSEHVLVYRFTLHRDGGVTCLDWDEHSNNVASKGAKPSDDARFAWTVEGDDFVYVDPEASTEETVVGYAYSVFGDPIPEGESVQLKIWTYDVPYIDAYVDEGLVHEQELEIPCTKAVASVAFETDGGGSANVSPLGLVLDTRSLFASSEDPAVCDLAADPVNVRAITLKMNDGETYAVFEKAAFLDNTLAACEFETDFAMAFNRLVDPEEVASIEITVTDESVYYELLKEGAGMPSIDELPTKTVTLTRQ